MSTEDKPTTHVAFILDRSGSMISIQAEIVQAFNEQVGLVAKESETMPTKVYLNTFSTYVDPPTLWAADPKYLRPLEMADYSPSGSTAMLDAVVSVVDRLEEEVKPNDNVLILTISDGQENNSRTSYEAVAERVRRLQDGGHWTFTYLGSNQDLTEVAQRLNIPVGNMGNFEASPVGVKGASVVAQASVGGYYKGLHAGHTQVNSFYSNSTGDPAPEQATNTSTAGSVVKAIRNRNPKGFSATNIARSLGVSPKTVYRWQSGESDAHPTFKEKLMELGKNG